jgi:hypothetical protein
MDQNRPWIRRLFTGAKGDSGTDAGTGEKDTAQRLITMIQVAKKLEMVKNYYENFALFPPLDNFYIVLLSEKLIFSGSWLSAIKLEVQTLYD